MLYQQSGKTPMVLSKKYTYALVIYLMTELAYSYVFIMDSAINAPGHGNNVVDGLNAIGKRYLKGKWKLLVN